jgi:hypothetical protein
MSHTLFIESNIMENKNYVKKIIAFCCSICTQITFETCLGNYNLSMVEYEKACSDFLNYYELEDEKRRNEFSSNSDYKRFVVNTYPTENEVTNYFDRLHQYDMIQFTELKNNLSQYLMNSTKNNISLAKNHKANVYAVKEVSLPKDAYQSNMYSFNSHCTIGGLYKVYRFNLIRSVVNYLMKEDYLFKYYEFDDTDKLENPAFYLNNSLILSICSHERTSALYLSDNLYKIFKGYDIPYSI